MADLQRKTANLFDESTIQNGYYGSIGSLSTFTNDDRYRAFQMPIKAGTYTIKIQADEGIRLLRIATVNEFYNVQEDNRAYTFVISSDAIVYVSWRNLQTTNSFTNMTVMLNLGSTALPYEPYGWVHSLRKLTTSTDTITTLPADLYADGTNATVGLAGNMVQSGTPSPDNPIQPSECGERTENLFDKDNTTVYNAYIGNNSYWLLNADSRSIKIVCSPNTTYTLTINVPNNAVFRIYETDNENAEPASSETVLLTEIIRGTTNQSYSFTTRATTKAIVFQGSAAYVTDWINSLMLSTGSTALPYEPWGYKIPISSGGVTTPVYLGEVESTRRIKKVVLTGSETIFTATQTNTSGLYCFVYDYAALSMDDILNYLDDMSTIPYPFFVSSHFKMKTATKPDSYKDIADGEVGANSNVTVTGVQNRFIVFCKSGITTAADFKSYLAQQYAAGTPVCVWYVLATPQTAVVNEPLRKIGDYADTVSGISIPTITGADSFDVLTTLKPSEVELTYTGWHDATVKEWDGSQWQ